MDKFTVLDEIAAPLMRENVDTDVIIRIERLVSLENVDLGKWAFELLRYRPDGSENPDFILNQPRYRASRILLAGRNFGCGSSREGAVVAVLGMGIRCVIAPSFGDIFFGNCFQNGVLPIALPQAEIDKLAQEARLHARRDLHGRSGAAGDPDPRSARGAVHRRPEPPPGAARRPRSNQHDAASGVRYYRLPAT